MESRIYKKFTIVNFIFTFSLALFSSLIAPYLAKKGFSESQIHLMFSVLPLTIFLFLPFLGKVADKIGRNFVIWTGIFFEILAIFLYVLNSNWLLIVLARFFDAISASVVTLIVISRLIDGKTKTRGRYTGWSLSFGAFASMIGPLFGSFLADSFFIQAPFIVAIIILFILLIFLFSKDFIKQIQQIRFLKLSWWSEVKLFLSNKQLKGTGILGMVMHATNPLFNVFLPILITQKLKLSYSAIGIAMFFYASSHLFQQVFGKWADKIGYWRGVIFGTFFCGIFLMFISTIIIIYFW